MKNILAALLLMLVMLPAFGQMPTNGNYTNWNWENQNQDNWKRKDGNIWTEINPPFDPVTERIGTIVDVFATTDYTKAKGWKLVWAQFDGVYPYFILYNSHKGLVRAFFYLDTQEFNYALATLSYHDTNNPGIITFGNEYQIAADKYLDGSLPSDDMISVIIPFVGTQNWCSADFPIYFDPNIKNAKYNSKKWVFKFYGCDNYQISLKGQTGPASNAQQTISGKSSDVTATNLSATHAKLHKQLETTDKFLQQMQSSVKNINSSSPSFLQGYQKTVQNLKPVTDIFSTVVSISSGVGAVLGFMKVVNGSFNKEQSTVPAAVIQYLELEGSMQIKYNLGGNTLKIPGVTGDYFPAVNWNPYNCVLGYFNLEKTPTIRKTSAYEKFAFDDPVGTISGPNGEITWLGGLFNFPILAAGGVHPPVSTSTYLGKFIKYKFEDDNKIAINNIPGLSLIDIHFALVFKLTGTGLEKFSIEQKYIYCKFWDQVGREFSVPVVNPVYKELEEGILKIYKFDDANDGIYLGTPELPMNQLKDIIIEIPEKADLALRVIARFNSNKYNTPIIFQGNYNMNTQNEAAKESRIFWLMEQNNFPWADYYNVVPLITLANTNSTVNTANTILLKPGFLGRPGFSAIAKGIIYPTRGNTQISSYNFNCTDPGREKSIDEVDSNTVEFSDSNLDAYPNPTTGETIIRYTVSKKGPVKLFITDNMGRLTENLIDNQNLEAGEYKTTFNCEGLSSGIYFYNLITSGNSEVKRLSIIND